MRPANGWLAAYIKKRLQVPSEALENAIMRFLHDGACVEYGLVESLGRV